MADKLTANNNDDTAEVIQNVDTNDKISAKTNKNGDDGSDKQEVTNVKIEWKIDKSNRDPERICWIPAKTYPDAVWRRHKKFKPSRRKTTTNVSHETSNDHLQVATRTRKSMIMCKELQELESQREESHDAVDKLVYMWDLQHNSERYHGKIDAYIDEQKRIVKKRYSVS